MGALKRKTRILCTHHWKYLRHADVIVVMQNGTIACQGPPHEILKRNDLIQNATDEGLMLPSTTNYEFLTPVIELIHWSKNLHHVQFVQCKHERTSLC